MLPLCHNTTGSSLAGGRRGSWPQVKSVKVYSRARDSSAQSPARPKLCAPGLRSSVCPQTLIRTVRFPCEAEDTLLCAIVLLLLAQCSPLDAVTRSCNGLSAQPPTQGLTVRAHLQITPLAHHCPINETARNCKSLVNANSTDDGLICLHVSVPFVFSLCSRYPLASCRSSCRCRAS